MKAKEYRAQYEKKLRRVAEEESKRSARTIHELLSEKAADSETRASAIQTTHLKTPDRDGLIARYLKTLDDSRETVEVRRAALNALKAADFLGPKFDPYRAEFLQVLRKMSKDRSPTLRQEALEVLALNRDPYAQEVLIAGLRDEEAALVPVAKAIQLLSHDEHNEAVPVVREMFDELDVDAKQEAVRLLSSDPDCEPLFSRLISDKSEQSAIRQLSAVALQNVNPQAFEKIAGEIVTDEEEYPEIQATCVSALTAQQARKSPDKAFMEKIAQVRKRTNSTNLQSSIKRYMKTRE